MSTGVVSKQAILTTYCKLDQIKSRWWLNSS